VTRLPKFEWERALLASDLSPTARHVVLTIAVCMSKDGDGAYPSRTRLAKETGRSVSTVARALAELRDAGYLQIRSGGGRDTQGRRRANTYWATVPVTRVTSVTGDDDPCHPRPAPVSPVQPTRVTGDTPPDQHQPENKQPAAASLTDKIVDTLRLTGARATQVRKAGPRLVDAAPGGWTTDEIADQLAAVTWRDEIRDLGGLLVHELRALDGKPPPSTKRLASAHAFGTNRALIQPPVARLDVQREAEHQYPNDPAAIAAVLDGFDAAIATNERKTA